MSSDATAPALYAAIKPYKTHQLPVSPIHTLWVQEFGNPNGLPAVHLHGGPGGGCDDKDARRFDPDTYRIVLFDQRGSGKSTPSSCLEDNTTWTLVDDVEKIRKHLQIDQWLVFGGSWGSTLALAYAQTYPAPVLALVLRGIFTLRKAELDWFYSYPFNGPGHLFPEEYEKYIAQVPEDERGDVVAAYHKCALVIEQSPSFDDCRRLTSEDAQVRKKAAQAWCRWEMATSHLLVSAEDLSKAEEDAFADVFARIECHFFVNKGFMEDGFLLRKEQIDKIRHIPCTIVQGRYDLVCPFFTAHALRKAWPEAKFVDVPDAGHSANEPGTQQAL